LDDFNSQAFVLLTVYFTARAEFIIGFSVHPGFTDMTYHSKRTAQALLALVLAGATTNPAYAAEVATPWVATWTASPQPVWGNEFLFPTNVPATLHDQTFRQVARIGLGGPRVRLVFSNTYGPKPLPLGVVTVALSEGEDRVDAGSVHRVTFDGKSTATIASGAPLVSDPIPLQVPALAKLTISVHVPGETPVTTFHWDGRQTAWIVPGDQTAAPRLDTAQATTTTARLLLSGIEVEAGNSIGTVAVIGDSITDGATASLDSNSRWPDFLATRLAPHRASVINAGISGGRLLSDGMGVNALARLDRDVLAQPGVRTIVVLLGINDISWPGTTFAPQARRPTLDDLAAGYRQLVARARSRGMRVVGATLTPFEGALPGTPLADYYHADKDALRRQLNDWIRTSGTFDAVLDFDVLMRDRGHPARFDPRFDSGDHLHPGDEGNRAMAESVDLELLLPGITARGAVATSQAH